MRSPISASMLRQHSKAGTDAPRGSPARLAWRVQCWSGERFGEPVTGPGWSVEVEAIEVHDLVPGGHEVPHELLLPVVRCVDLRDASELGVRTEDEVDGGGGP